MSDPDTDHIDPERLTGLLLMLLGDKSRTAMLWSTQDVANLQRRAYEYVALTCMPLPAPYGLTVFHGQNDSFNVRLFQVVSNQTLAFVAVPATQNLRDAVNDCLDRLANRLAREALSAFTSLERHYLP